MKRLNDLIHGNHPGYLTPLFWTHGEDEQVLRHMIMQILDEAKKRNMGVWFFDDNKYPSGYSAGRIRDNHPEYLKIYLCEGHIDAVGPLDDSYIFLDAWLEEKK